MKLLKSELFHLYFSKFYETVTFQTRAMVWDDSVHLPMVGYLLKMVRKTAG